MTAALDALTAACLAGGPADRPYYPHMTRGYPAGQPRVVWPQRNADAVVWPVPAEHEAAALLLDGCWLDIAPSAGPVRWRTPSGGTVGAVS